MSLLVEVGGTTTMDSSDVANAAANSKGLMKPSLEESNEG